MEEEARLGSKKLDMNTTIALLVVARLERERSEVDGEILDRRNEGDEAMPRTEAARGWRSGRDDVDNRTVNVVDDANSTVQPRPIRTKTKGNEARGSGTKEVEVPGSNVSVTRNTASPGCLS
jgi:hypothetical protein